MLSEPIFAKDGTHERPNRAFQRSLIKPRHAVDEILQKLRAFDRDNPLKSKKMRWLMREAFPGESAEEIFARSKELWRATTVEARDNENITSRHKVRLENAVARRDPGFSSEGAKPVDMEGAQYALDPNTPSRETPLAKAIAGQWHAHDRLPGFVGKLHEIVRSDLPESWGKFLDVFENVTGTKVAVVRGVGKRLDINGVRYGKNTLVVNADTLSSPTKVVSHEWVHDLAKTKPELYNALKAEVERQGLLDKYAASLREGETAAGIKNQEKTNVLEEFTGDAVAEAMSDRSFLEKLAKNSPTTFQKIAKSFIEFIDNLTKSLREGRVRQFLPEFESFKKVLQDQLEKHYPQEGAGNTMKERVAALRAKAAEKTSVLDSMREVEKRLASDMPAKGVKAVQQKGMVSAIGESTKKAADSGKLAQASEVAKAVEPPRTGLLQRLKDIRYMWALSSLGALVKLPMAALTKIMISPVELATIQAFRILPAMNRFAAGAERFSGWNSMAESQAWKQTFSLDTLKQMKQALKTGKIDIDKYGDFVQNYLDNEERELTRPVLDFFTRLHVALKTPARINEYTRGSVMLRESAIQRGMREGLSAKEAIAQADSEEQTINRQTAAYLLSKRAVMLGSNELHTALEGLLKSAQASENPLIAGVGHTAELLAPIRKVPINIGTEALEYAFGGLNSLYTLAKHGVTNMKPETRDYVLRNMSRQTIGTVLAICVIEGLIKGGGYYTGDKRDWKQKLHAMELEVAGKHVSHSLVHSPVWDVAQILSTYNKFVEYKNTPVTAAYKTAFAFAGEHSPLMDLQADLVRGLNRRDSGEEMINNTIANFVVPSLLTNAATILDEQRHPEVSGRKAKTLTEKLQKKLPIVREDLPPYLKTREQMAEE